MLSSVLRGKRAVDITLAIVRTFIWLPHILATNEDLARNVARHDRQIAVLFEHVQKMLARAPVKKNPIGLFRRRIYDARQRTGSGRRISPLR